MLVVKHLNFSPRGTYVETENFYFCEGEILKSFHNVRSEWVSITTLRKRSRREQEVPT